MNKWDRLLMTVLPVLMLLALLVGASPALAAAPQVAAGADFTVSLHSDGTLWASGTNAVGQLGLGTALQQQVTPVQVGTGTDWTAVAAGADHTVALKADGTLWAWGSNQFGQLGTTPGINQPAPVQVGSDSTWVEVSAGEFITVALKADGTLWASGLNSMGQLGNGALVDQPAFVQVLNQGTSRYVAVSAGGEHVLALQADGSLWSWGSNEFGQLGKGDVDTLPHATPVQIATTGTGWIAISGGGGHSAALQADGTLWTWGENNFGQLGDGTAAANRPQPVQVAGGDWARVSAGELHTLAVKTTGALYAWGNNADGQLGAIEPDVLPHATPLQITNHAGIFHMVAVAAGPGHSLALKVTGEVFAWGDNALGALGDGTTVSSTIPVLVAQDVVSWVGAEPGVLHTVARRSDGSLWAWGDNFLGQIGLDPLVTTGSTTPVEIQTPATWTTQSAGSGHTLAIRPNGTLWSWGDNGSGQLGTEPVDPFQPTQVTATNDWTAVAAGDFHSLGLRADGTLWAWGDNGSNQLGDPLLSAQPQPVQVLTPGALGTFDSNWVAVAANGDYSLGLQADGTLWGWGSNGFGQLGLDPVVTPVVTAPTQLVNLAPPVGNLGFNSNWRAVAGGFQHMLGLQADGTVWALGANNFGQLGNGSSTASFDFVQVINDDPAIPYVAIAAGDAHSVARRADGTVWSWGSNTSGQLGIGSTDPPIDFENPVLIPHGTPLQESSTARDWVTISAGGSHTVALKADGTLAAWGDNAAGQLGDGTTVTRDAPTALREPRISVPAEVSFGTVAVTVGPFIPQPVTITNTGTGNLEISAITKLNDALNVFTLAPGDCAPVKILTAGSSCTASVTFTPAAPVAYTATLSIASSDPSAPVTVVNLAGTGVNPFTITSSVDPASPGGSGTVSPLGAVLLAPGGSQGYIFTANTAGGFTVKDIVVDGISRGAADSLTFSDVRANHTIVVTFSNTRTITATSGPGGTISPKGLVPVNPGSQQSFIFTPNFGYAIADVRINNNTVSVLNDLINRNSYTFYDLQADDTIEVTYVLNPANTWKWRNPVPQGMAISRMATDGTGKYVAVGEFGTILTSSDSASWTVRQSGSQPINGVAYGAGTFVVAGHDGRIFTSTDSGVTWNAQSSGTTAHLNAVTYNGTVFVAVGNMLIDSNFPFVPRAVIVTSPDGITWTPRYQLLPLGDSLDLYDVAAGSGGKLAAVGAGGAILTSSDNGFTWATIPADPFDRGGNINGITFGANTFVAVGDSAQVTTSSDNGATWVPQPVFSFADLLGAAYGTITPDPLQPLNTIDAFIAVGAGGEILISENLGANWTTQTTVLDDTGATVELRAALIGLDKSVVPNVNHVMVAGDWGHMLRSVDLSSWSFVSRTASSRDLKGVTGGNSVMVAVGGTPVSTYAPATATLLSSVDNGLSWAGRALPGGSQNLTAASYGNGKYVAVGASSYLDGVNPGGEATILTSSDGISWNSRNSDSFLGLNAITFTKGRFIAVGDYNNKFSGAPFAEGAVILTSTDGANWTLTQKITSTAGNLTGIAAGTVLGVDALVAVGEFGTVLVSTDNGLTWTETTDSAINGADLTAVTFGNGSFMAVATTNEVYASANRGATWSAEILPIPTTLTVKLQGITYFNGLFVAAGNDHFIVSKTTAPGSTWTINTGYDYVNSSLHGITAVNGFFIAVGQSGHILQTNGLAGALPQIKVTSELDLGSILVGKTSAPQTITITNIGNADLSLGAISMDPAGSPDFSFDNNFCTTAILPPTGSCTTEVIFHPSATGERHAALSVLSSDPDTAVVTVPLEGAGLPSFTLGVTNAGNGRGSVTSSPAGIAILSGISGAGQTAVFAAGSTVTLTATADADSLFTGWSGPGAGTCTTSVVCSVAVNAAKSITANFALSLPVAAGVRLTSKTAPNTYATITEAFAAALNNTTATIDTLAFATADTGFTVNRGIKLTLNGGLASGFAGSVGMTTLSGGLTVSTGSLTISNVIIK